MSWIVEVSPPWNIAPGEEGSESWAPVGENLNAGATVDSEFATEAEALAFLRVVQWSVASSTGYQPIGSIFTRQFRARELT